MCHYLIKISLCLVKVAVRFAIQIAISFTYWNSWLIVVFDNNFLKSTVKEVRLWLWPSLSQSFCLNGLYCHNVLSGAMAIVFSHKFVPDRGEVGDFFQGARENSSAPFAGWEVKMWPCLVHKTLPAQQRTPSTLEKMCGSAKFLGTFLLA